MTSPRPWPASLRTWSLLASLLLGVAQGCGDGTPDDDLSSKARHPDNYEAWRDAWDGERWIVATSDLRPREDALRTAFARAFSHVLETRGAWGADGALGAAAHDGFLPRAARIPLLSINGVSAPPGGTCDVKRCPTFAFVRLPHGRVPWDTLFPSGAFSPFDFSFAKTADVMRLHWDTLNSMEGVLYAEPDLAAPSANVKGSSKPKASPTPRAKDKGKPSALAEEAMEYPEHINVIQLPQAEAAEKKNNYVLKDVVVAVLDTGVDRLHPSLKERMFQLPGRDPASPPAVFKQGDFEYLGDAYGIDASWEKSLSADLVAASPGSADIGGPGKPCPTAEDGSLLNSLSGTNCSHGTHVAGLVAAAETPPGVAGNSTAFTIRGVCRNCKIVSVRAASVDLTGTAPNNGKILDSSQIRGMQFVASLRADSSNLYVNVLNMSIGQYDDSRAMRSILNSLQESGIVLVAAASNNNTDRRAFPAAYQGVVAVCATSVEGSRGRYGKAVFSNFGEWIDICAPGESILSTVPGERIEPQNGTSMAAPIVAGVAGYLMGIAESLGIPAVGRAETIVSRMLAASNWGLLYSSTTAPFNEPYQFKLPDGTGAEFLGRGFLDMENALTLSRAVERTQAPEAQVTRGCVASTIGQPNPNAVGDALTSVPLLLGAFVLLLRIRTARRRRALPMRRSPGTP